MRSIALQLAGAAAHAVRCHSGAAASTSGVAAAAAAAARMPRTGGWREQLLVYKQLSKFRLSALVVSTAAAGFVMGAPAAIALALAVAGFSTFSSASRTLQPTNL